MWISAAQNGEVGDPLQNRCVCRAHFFHGTLYLRFCLTSLCDHHTEKGTATSSSGGGGGEGGGNKPSSGEGGKDSESSGGAADGSPKGKK